MTPFQTICSGTLLLGCLSLGAAEPPFVHFDFNGVDNGVVVDTSGNRNDGRMSRMAIPSDGVDGRGVRFPDPNGYINVELGGKWRNLQAITVACWIAPEEIKHQVVAHSAPMKDSVDDASFSLRLREGWQVWFAVTAADGEHRGVATPGPGFDRIAYPDRRNWVFLAGTYDGETAALYVNGACVEKRKFDGAKKIKPITAPVRIGGDGLETYHGAIDEFSLHARALPPEEIKALYGARAGFKPQRIPPKNAGTIDGEPYAGCEQYASWMTVPLGSSRLFVSNTGEIRPFGCSPVCAQSQWIPMQPFAIPSQSNAREKFYRTLKGNVELRCDGSTRILLEGETAGGLAVKQSVDVTPEKDVKFSYSLAALKTGTPEPFIEFPLHLWPSAMRFTGSDARGPITGNLMDLEDTLLFTDALEINLVSSDNRLGFDFGKRARYQLVGTRDPGAWSNGYTTFPGRIVAAEAANRWTTEGRLTIDFTFRLEPDTLPPRLDRTHARKVTENRRFDFGKLYEKDPDRLGISPVDRDAPIYLDNEPASFRLNIPAKTVAASRRARKWFHLVGTYDGFTCRLYLNGKPAASQSYPVAKRITLLGPGTICVGGPQEPFQGAIDNVRVYRRALGPADVQAHFDERRDFKPGAPAEGTGGKRKPDDPALALWLDFDTPGNGAFVDRSPARLKVVSSGKATLCEGVDGSALSLADGASVKVDLPEGGRDFEALTVEAWLSPEDPRYSTVLCGVHHENKYNAHPFMLRWRQGNEFWFQLNTPDGELRSCAGGPASATIFYPDRYAWTLTNCFTKGMVRTGEFARNAQTGEFERTLALPVLPPAVYEVKVEALDAAGKTIEACASELAVAGEIPQARSKAGRGPELKKVDEADLTREDPGHDFYSRSGHSKVVKGGKGSYRQTLTTQDYYRQLDREGSADRHAADWFGVRFRTEPGKIYLLEIEYPDLPCMSMSEYLLEPAGDPADGRCKPVQKTSSGIFTGSFLPHDNGLKTHRLVHFASAPWVAVCLQNAHVLGRPDATTVLDPASCARIILHEVVGDLPALNAPLHRQLGVHTEDGGLSLGSFGLEKFRGELAAARDRPKTGDYYRHATVAVSNLIRYMRYRGDTTLFYGAYRYRAAQFPSRLFPPADPDVDLPALMARLFERNGLKLVLNVEANNPLPESRLHESTHFDVWRGDEGVSNVNANGRQNAGGSAIFPISNPWHPKVREEYDRLASELGERYGKYPAVAGLSWITGQCWWSPTLALPIDPGMDAARAEDALLGLTSDDETFRQFEAWSGLKVPLQAPPDSPARFKERHEWVMKNARDRFVAFRDWAMSQTHLAFRNAFAAKAPGKDYLAIDFCYHVFSGAAEWPAALDAVRRIGFGPEYARGVPGFLYCAYMPEANGCTYWEHAGYRWEWMPRVARFLQDDAYAKALEGAGRTARYIHRQFYEQCIHLSDAPNGKWMWAPDVSFLACISYPQQGGRGYLADFVYQLARGNPDYICYSWCDSLIPMGHEPEHRELAAAYRSIPPGAYGEYDRKDGVFLRLAAGKNAFYVVNTNGAAAQASLKTGVSGTWHDAVSGEGVRCDGDAARFSLKAFECQVYLPNSP